jgi:hypothetical protein
VPKIRPGIEVPVPLFELPAAWYSPVPLSRMAARPSSPLAEVDIYQA